MTEAEIRLKSLALASKIERDEKRGGGLPLAIAIAEWVCSDMPNADIRMKCCESVSGNGGAPKGIANYLQAADSYYRFATKDFPVVVAEKPQELSAPAQPDKPTLKKKRKSRRIAPFPESN